MLGPTSRRHTSSYPLIVYRDELHSIIVYMADITPVKRARLLHIASPAPKFASRSIYATRQQQPSKSLDDVPLELLTIILDDLPSPRDVLAVARTSRHLCHTLLNPLNKSIWRRARERFPAGPVPEPPKGWSEPAHAAFVFDVGNCEVRFLRPDYICYASVN
jgi:hypothetical protein